MVPARLVQAAAPILFGVLAQRYGAGALWLSAGLELSASQAAGPAPKRASLIRPRCRPP